MGRANAVSKLPFVLVHGSWHGGWCWQDVAPLLKAAGHRVFTPTLTGLAERAHLLSPAVNLATHVDDVVGLLQRESLADVVLVGHSYAGVVISAVAALAPERLALLVYLDGYLLGPGQSLLDLWPPAERATAIAAIATGAGLRPAPSAAHLGIRDPDLAARVESRLTPHPLRTYADPVPDGGPATAALPRAYIHCSTGPTVARFGPMAARAASAGWPVRELAVGHDAMLIAPDQCAAALLGIAGEVLPQ